MWSFTPDGAVTHADERRTPERTNLPLQVRGAATIVADVPVDAGPLILSYGLRDENYPSGTREIPPGTQAQ
jgi:hypothetical protein